MSEFIFKLPDLGEGTVEAEIVDWYVHPGDVVVEGQVIADVTTEKANIEIPAPVSGRVLRITGDPGDVVAVGEELIAIATSTDQPVQAKLAHKPSLEPRLKDATCTPAARVATTPAAAETASAPPTSVLSPSPPAEFPATSAADVGADGSEARARIVTSPAIRKRANEAGIDLASINGSGPNGRILSRDLDAYIGGANTASAPSARASTSTPATQASDVTFQDVKVIGIRRVIAERLVHSKREIPHFAYVEEVDVSELEQLRGHLQKTQGQSLSILPFIATALLRTLVVFRECNAHYDAETGMLRKFHGVHLGIAAQTPDGLKVPVIKNAHKMSIWQLAAAIAELAERARSGDATPIELTGSTISLTSLGKLGGVVSTPIINRPEVAIIGVNKVIERPTVVNKEIHVRAMMNLSSSFDHRFIDGFYAASMIQAIKQRLEHPATLFMPDP